MLVCPQPHRQSFQSTLPHGSDRGYSLRAYLLLTISIHAPVVVPAVISIHAPSRERQFNLGEGLTITDISIHAPLRERRSTALCSDQANLFQSTLPCGSDVIALINSSRAPLFQSTLPCGSDIAANLLHLFLVNISIHAPLRERQ